MERELVWFYLCAGYGDSFPVRYPFPLLRIKADLDLVPKDIVDI